MAAVPLIYNEALNVSHCCGSFFCHRLCSACAVLVSRRFYGVSTVGIIQPIEGFDHWDDDLVMISCVSSCVKAFATSDRVDAMVLGSLLHSPDIIKAIRSRVILGVFLLAAPGMCLTMTATKAMNATHMLIFLVLVLFLPSLSFSSNKWVSRKAVSSMVRQRWKVKSGLSASNRRKLPWWICKMARRSLVVPSKRKLPS